MHFLSQKLLMLGQICLTLHKKTYIASLFIVTLRYNVKKRNTYTWDNKGLIIYLKFM